MNNYEIPTMSHIITLLESDDFFINIISTIIGVVLTFLLDKYKNTAENTAANISISVNYYIEHKITNRSDNGLLNLFVFIFFIYYLFKPNDIHFLSIY
ncbi:hypothetical protein A6B39_07235 [Mannheimia granulomatis]|nr:hypothetical protein A6B39_07235 [Mannheimia granulomatis]